MQKKKKEKQKNKQKQKKNKKAPFINIQNTPNVKRIQKTFNSKKRLEISE